MGIFSRQEKELDTTERLEHDEVIADTAGGGKGRKNGESGVDTYTCVCVLSRVQCFEALWSPPGSCIKGDFSRNTGVGGHALLPGILPTQGSNRRLLCLLSWQAGPLPTETPEKI